MSIRLRLALWYGALFALILLLLGLLMYALHARSLYSDVDRALVTSGEHAVAEAEASNTGPHLVEGHGGFEVILLLYDPAGTQLATSTGNETLPRVDPKAVLHAPAGPAFDALAGVVPGLDSPSPHMDGAFGLIRTSEERWRVYVVPLRSGGALDGYVAALTPLGQVDSAVLAFRLMLLALGGVGGLQ